MGFNNGYESGYADGVADTEMKYASTQGGGGGAAVGKPAISRIEVLVPTAFGEPGEWITYNSDDGARPGHSMYDDMEAYGFDPKIRVFGRHLDQVDSFLYIDPDAIHNSRDIYSPVEFSRSEAPFTATEDGSGYLELAVSVVGTDKMPNFVTDPGSRGLLLVANPEGCSGMAFHVAM